MDKKDWILQSKETPRIFSKATWIPLRASLLQERNDIKSIGFVSDFFGCGSVAFPLKHRKVAESLTWTDIGIIHDAEPYAYTDGHYSSVEEYEHNDKEAVGINLVFNLPQPVIGGKKWMVNPDLIIALRLIKEGNSWVRPEENFIEVIKETIDEDGNHLQIEIKREFLIDYLAARNLSLRLSYYRQRVENVATLESSEYEGLTDHQESRSNGRFELLIRSLDDVYGGSWSMVRAWRTDVDEHDDAPILNQENDENTDFETSQGRRGGYDGVRIESEFWRDEWIEHQGQSIRVRGDDDTNLPQFIIETDGARSPSADLNNEDIGRWLWFRSGVVNELLGFRGFSLEWYTAETGSIHSTTGYKIHFGINSSDLITVYAYDIAKLPAWEQYIWAGHNVVPEGKVSSELLASQVKCKPASTHAVEDLFFKVMQMLEEGFHQKFNVPLFAHSFDNASALKQISRFMSTDQTSLLRLAKDLVRLFSDRLNVKELRKLATNADKEKFGSNKLLQDILENSIGAEKARAIFTPIVGVYEMRLGDAHPMSSKITEAIKLAGVDEDGSFLRQGEQLISNFGQSIWHIGKSLFNDS
jgi:hypothetical protein